MVQLQLLENWKQRQKAVNIVCLGKCFSLDLMEIRLPTSGTINAFHCAMQLSKTA